VGGAGGSRFFRFCQARVWHGLWKIVSAGIPRWDHLTLFEELERPALKPLPQEAYIFSETIHRIVSLSASLKTALNQWAYARAHQTSDQREAHLPEWIHSYNWHRPHGGINSAKPISRRALTGDNLVRLHS